MLPHSPVHFSLTFSFCLLIGKKFANLFPTYLPFPPCILLFFAGLDTLIIFCLQLFVCGNFPSLSSFPFPSNLTPFFLFKLCFCFATTEMPDQLPPLSDSFCTFSLAAFFLLLLLGPSPALLKFLGGLGLFLFCLWFFG